VKLLKYKTYGAHTDVVDNNIVVTVFAGDRHARSGRISGRDVISLCVSGSGVGFVVARGPVVVIVVCSVARRPLHLVLLLESTSRVGEPRRHLGQRHLGDDGQHDLLTLGRIRVLNVLVQPCLERARRLSSSVLASDIQTSVTASATSNHRDNMIHIFTARCYAERGIATASRLSVRPSVTLRYHGHIGLITYIYSFNYHV